MGSISGKNPPRVNEAHDLRSVEQGDIWNMDDTTPVMPRIRLPSRKMDVVSPPKPPDNVWEPLTPELTGSTEKYALVWEPLTPEYVRRIEDYPTNKVPVFLVEETKKTQKKAKSKLFSLIARIVITVLLFVILFKGVQWSKTLNALSHIQFTELLVGLCIGTLGVVFSAYVWQRLVVAENIQTDLARLTNLYLVGVAFNHFLPTSMGGDAVKAFYVGRDSGNIVGSASAVLMSRITGFIGMLLVALPALLLMDAELDHKVIQQFLLLSLLFITGIGGSLIASVLLPKFPWLSKRAWAKHKIMVKVLEVGTTMGKSLGRPRVILESVLFGILFWITNCLNFYEYGQAVGLHVPFTFYLIAIPFVGIVGALPISINGFGVRESLVVYLFSTIHVPSSVALLVVLLMDVQRLFFGLVGGGIYLLMEDKAQKSAKMDHT